MNSFIHDKAANTYKTIIAVTGEQIIQLAQEILYSSLQITSTEPLTNPTTVRQFLKLKLAHKQKEVFACLFMDNQHRLIHYEELFQGTIDSANVYPREVVKAALQHNAAAVIFAHNHPSGESEPSIADQHITERLKQALALVDIRTLDHFVIGHHDPVSFAEKGLL